MHPFLSASLGVLLVLAATPASAASQKVSVQVRYAISGIQYSKVTISCGTFTGFVPKMPGSKPLKHVWMTPTAASGTATMSLEVTPDTFWIGCWPSTTLSTGFDKTRTTSMVVYSASYPLPPKPVTFLSPLTIVGKGH